MGRPADHWPDRGAGLEPISKQEPGEEITITADFDAPLEDFQEYVE